LRHLLDLLEGDLATIYPDLGLDGYRPRFTPVVRALAALGPLSIRDLALAVGVTHSAASQTVSQLTRRGLVALDVGEDARQRIVRLTEQGSALLPVLAAEWAVAETAVAELDAELPCPLDEVVTAALRALERRPFRQRIADAAAARERGATGRG
jgi:DNA-binding MarR family transcriptional regulator